MLVWSRIIPNYACTWEATYYSKIYASIICQALLVSTFVDLSFVPHASDTKSGARVVAGHVSESRGVASARLQVCKETELSALGSVWHTHTRTDGHGKGNRL